MACSNNNSIFGSPSGYLKFQGNDVIAVEGASVIERMLLGDLRIPYEQILRSRITLKAGQLNYLLNFLSLGDNATFVFIAARYNSKSVNEEDNYIRYTFYDDTSRVYTFGPLLFLTGNSTNRVKQIYLSNPNEDYAVQLEVVVGIIDDSYSFFTDVLNQSGTSFTDLTYLSIETHVPDESVVIYDNGDPRSPLSYLSLTEINSIERSNKILTIDEETSGKFFLEFTSEYDAKQVHSLINYSIENAGIIIQNLDPVTDDTCPVVYFRTTAGTGGYTIQMSGATTSGPYNTSQGVTFSATVSIAQFGYNGTITKSSLLNLLVNSVYDNRDGQIGVTDSSITVRNSSDVAVSSIGTTGTFSVTFNIEDVAENPVSTSTVLNLNIIT